MNRFESMSDSDVNALVTQRVYGLENYVYDPDEFEFVYDDGTSFPIVDFVDDCERETFKLMKEHKISVCLDDGESFAFHGRKFYGDGHEYDHESHNENINRAILNVYLSMTDKV